MRRVPIACCFRRSGVKSVLTSSDDVPSASAVDFEQGILYPDRYNDENDVMKDAQGPPTRHQRVSCPSFVDALRPHSRYVTVVRPMFFDRCYFLKFSK